MTDRIMTNSSYPSSYRENSELEETLLNELDNALKQYYYLNPNRVKLFIYPLNECEVSKFVCTSIKPSVLTDISFTDCENISKFVSEYVLYKSLECSYKLPTMMASPSTVLKRQYGNCFEISTLLVCLLEGLGYDAYVVSGYASREVCNADLSFTDYDESTFENFEYSNLIDNISNNYEIKDHKSTLSDIQKQKNNNLFLRKLYSTLDDELLSEYDQKMLKRCFNVNNNNKVLNGNGDKQVNSPIDILKGIRIHAWVLCLPKNNYNKESFFIEPSTGMVKVLNDDNYYGIENVWNSKNYWINYQDCGNGLADISYDLEDNNKWEKLLHHNHQQKKDQFEIKQFKIYEKQRKEYIYLPKPWIEDLIISKNNIFKKYPNGQKTSYYYKTLVKSFSPYSNKNGCTLKIHKYKDVEMNNLSKRIFLYENRCDKLYLRVICHETNFITEYFDIGQRSAIVCYKYFFNAINNDNYANVMLFDDSLRNDSLLLRRESKLCLEEYYNHRKDRLFYTCVFYESSSSPSLGNNNKLIYKQLEKGKRIEKIINKYTRDDSVDYNEDIYQAIFNIKESTIKIEYHRNPLFIISSSRTFFKPAKLRDIEAGFTKLKWNQNLHSSYEVGPTVKPKTPVYLYNLLLNLMKDEDKTINRIRESENELKNMLKELTNDRVSNELEKNKFEIDVDKLTKYIHQINLKYEFEKSLNEKPGKSLDSYDYIEPYMHNLCINNNTEDNGFIIDGNLKNLLKAKLLNDTKNIYLTRINTLQKKYNEENKLLNEIYHGYNKNKYNLNEFIEKDLSNKIESKLFYVNLLKNRLNNLKFELDSNYNALCNKIENEKRFK